MRRFMVLFLLAVFLPFGITPIGTHAQSAANIGFSPPYVEGEAIVCLRGSSALNKAAIGVLEYSHQVSAEEVFDLQEATLQHVVTRKGQTTAELLSELRSDPEVLYAQPNHIVTAQLVPNDPWFGFDGSPWNVSNATEAYMDKTEEAQNETWVAVLDSGATFGEPDLVGKFVLGLGRDFVNEDNDPTDDFNHGSEMASEIGAIPNNNLKMVGFSGFSNTKILPLKVIRADNTGTEADLLQALAYVSTLKDSHSELRVVNLSLALGGSTAQRDALAVLAKKGVVVFASAGNSGGNNDLGAVYPASWSLALPNVIAVGGIDHQNNVASYSNYGAHSVTMFVPSEAQGIDRFGNSIGGFGTSTSAALSSALASVVASLHPEYGFWQVRQQILQTVTVRGDLAGKCVTSGALNAEAAVLESPELTATDQLNVTKIKWVSANGGTLKITVTSSNPEAVITAIGYDQAVKIKPSGAKVVKLKRFPVPPAGTTTHVTLISSAGDIQEVSFQVSADGTLRLLDE